MYEAYAFFITGLVYELGPPDIGIIQFIFKLNKQLKEKKICKFIKIIYLKKF